MIKTLLRSPLWLLAGLSVAIAQPAAQKPKKEFVQGKPAFAPNANQKHFVEGEIAVDHLEPKDFVVPEGLEVTLWAASPQLYNPTNMDVDAQGRIWVAEGVNYRSKAGRREAGDRIVVLEDTDGDGKADKSHTFVQDQELGAPLGVAVFDNVIVVSNAPNLIVYTDVNRDAVFDSKVDKREVLVGGFEQPQHDHSLHSVSAMPDGRWVFSNGNCGAQFTDKSGHQFNIGGAYLNNTYAGQPSYDGHIYTGGFTCSIDPDGKNARIIGHGYRNSYEQVTTSFGDVFQNDNDDPPACRVAHVIEGGFMGFFSPDGKRTWQADKRPGQTTQVAEWRQDDPSTVPAGDVYGGGAPTGIAFYENGALGDKWNGLLLSCDTGRNVVLGYLPKPDGAGFKLERFSFITSNTTGNFAGSDFVGGSKNMSDERHFLFRPSDVCVGTDGAVYVADWFDKRTGGHGTMDDSASGAIYRIAPKGFKPKSPKLDYKTDDGCIAALSSPAINVRNAAFSSLKAKGAKKLPVAKKLLEDKNPYVVARAVWLIAQLGDEGAKAVEERLQSKDDNDRLVAWRALRAAGKDMLPYAAKMSADNSPAVRREIAVSLRDVAADKALPILSTLGQLFNGHDRSYLGALGIGATGKESALWNSFSKGTNNTYAWLTWKLHPKEAVSWLKDRIKDDKLSIDRRKLAADTLAFIDSEEAAQTMLDCAKDTASPIAGDLVWWLIHRSTNDWAKYDVAAKLKSQGVLDPAKIKLNAVVTPPPMTEGLPKAEDVAKLKGDAAKGALAVQRCYMCHSVKGQGVDFGPGLTDFGAQQPAEIIADAIINPGKDIAHGFDGTTLMLKDGMQIDGLLLTDGDFVIIKSQGGVSQIVAKEKIKSKQRMKQSLMLSGPQLGMTAQDIADVIAYLKK